MNLEDDAFPLRTNYELTRILSAYNGSNDVQISKHFSRFESFISQSYKENKQTNSLDLTQFNKTVVPHNLTIVMGSKFNVLSRNFCEYGINDEKSKDFLKWLEDTLSSQIRF
jgi:hypothetical protein